MSAELRRHLVRQWFSGTLIGTLLIAVTSPWFVRSYLPRVRSADRNALIFPPHAELRWRREGYATTRIGSWGTPGGPERVPNSAIVCALWGDSQAEGVCVSDSDKIASLVTHRSGGAVQLLSMARSGDNSNDWIRQVAVLQRNGNRLGDVDQRSVKLDQHVFLVTELADWRVEPDVAVEAENDSLNSVARVVPAFAIQAIRNVATDGGTSERRQLRFGLGPKGDQRPERQKESAGADDVSSPGEQLRRLSDHTRLPCLFVYAPLWPSIVEGRVVVADPDADAFERFASDCSRLGFDVIDLRPLLTAAAERGDWPRGFHNGQIGQGHYNATGNRLIAERLLRQFVLVDAVD